VLKKASPIARDECNPEIFLLPRFGRGLSDGSPSRTSRRQPKSCCGLSPFRRATYETLAPGFKLSTRMRAFSSVDHRRRRPVPVISSIR
jgi:hypothetical protein